MSDAIRGDATHCIPPAPSTCLLPVWSLSGIKPAGALSEAIMGETSVVSTALVWSRLLAALGDHGKHLIFH